jgi:hypothetical protein
LGYGVIGNTTVSGTVILGSSPGIPALKYGVCARCIRVSNGLYRFETLAECMK